MLTELTWKDIGAKIAYLIETTELSCDDEFRIEQLAEMCRSVGYSEGRADTLRNLSKIISSELEKK